MFMILSAFAAASAPQQEAAKPPEADPIVCTRPRGTHEVGTRMRPKKVCMRKSDWEYQEKHTQRELNQINQRGNNPAPVGGRAGDPQ